MAVKARAAALALLVLALVPAPAFAWGTEAHKFIMRQAIDLLPPELKPFFVSRRDEVVVRSVDPDTWRLVGWTENPNHFLDFGIREYGSYPFTDLPREYGAALEKFGIATIERNGTLPWRFAEIFGNLRRGFEGFTRNNVFAPTDVVLFAGAAAHYIQDATQPLHATENYDGLQTGQPGVHARFETELFERYQSRLAIKPAAPIAITSARDAAFDTLLESYQQVQALLDADKAAAGGREKYDDGYFEAFFTKAKPMLEERLAKAITLTASTIISAWEQAGKPQVRQVPRAVQPIRK
jgi:hypothetical protein